MRMLKLVTHCTLLATVPSLLAQPPQIASYACSQKSEEWTRPATYDEIVEMLQDLESGALERRYSLKQLQRFNDYLVILAKEGILPGEFEEAAELEEDIEDLLYGESSAFELMHSLDDSYQYTIVPALLHGHLSYTIAECGKIRHAWKKTKQFVAKHKKAVIIGAIVVVAAAGLTVAAFAAGAAASTAAGAAGAAVASAVTPSSEAPLFESAMEEQMSAFKENIARENFFDPQSPSTPSLSLEETGRVIGPLFAHESFNQFNEQLANDPQLAYEIQSIGSHVYAFLPPEASDSPLDFGHDEIDRRFMSDYGSLFSPPGQEKDFHALSYQMRGEAARSYGYYTQAVNDFSKAIDMDPTDPTLYLQRSTSYFEMEQYERSFDDFHHFSAQLEKSSEKIPFSTSEFTLGFAKGLPKGIYESGEGIMLFLGDLVTHPIHTATQMYDALSTLAGLVRDDEWGVIGSVLSPEVYRLVTEWDTLPSNEKGELAGYAFGKHGADIAAPGAIAKIASKSAKSAKELAAVLKNLQTAEGTLILETAAGVGNTARAGEIIANGRKTAFLGDELGFTAKEMGQLKQAGKLETTITKAYENLSPPMKETAALYKEAQLALKQYVKKPMPEGKIRELIHKAGIPTFPRPKGIPENYIVMITNKGAGIEYVHPTNMHIRVRVMPGKPHSPNPCQQKPYVIQKIDGGAMDKAGNCVSPAAPEAHIPLEEFVYRSPVNGS